MCTYGLMDFQWRRMRMSVKPTRLKGVPFRILAFRKASAPFASVMLLDPHFCRSSTGASTTADFYPTVNAVLHHEGVDSEEDREGLGCHLGRGL